MLIGYRKKQDLKRLVNKKIQEKKMIKYKFHITFDKKGHVVSQDFYVEGSNNITIDDIAYDIGKTNWLEIAKENGR